MGVKMSDSVGIIKIKKRKNVTLIYTLLLIFLWILMAFNTSSADIGYYSNMFTRIRSGITYYAVEGGFYYLCRFAVMLGMNYPLFLKIYSGVAMMLISSTIVRYAKKPSIALLFYFCYPFILDIAQIRHFMAVAIFIFSIRYLEEFSIKNLIKYCMLVLLAATQHLLALAFFFFILVYVSDNKRVVQISVAFMIFMFVGQRLFINTSLYRSILGMRDAEIDYSQGISAGMFLQYFLFYAVLLGFCIYINKIKNGRSDLLFKISMLSAVFIPLLLIDFQFTMFFRSSIIVVYLYIANGICSMKKGNNRFGYGFLFSVFMILIFFNLFGPFSGYFESLTKVIFTENGLIGFVFSN